MGLQGQIIGFGIMETKLSVITINLNNSKGLRRTMESVFRQDYSDFEYIVIDGGSNDGSIDVIKEFTNVGDYKIDSITSSSPSRLGNSLKIPVQWISEKDNGIYDAMNKGIKRAKGQYCFFLNSGDYLASEFVFKEVFSGDPSEEIIFGNLIICLNEKVTGRIEGKTSLTFLDLYKSDVVKHQSTFIRRTLFERFGLYDEKLKIVADWAFFLKTIGTGTVSYRYVKTDIAYFDNGGISNFSGEITRSERESVLVSNIPHMILADYRKFENYYLIGHVLNYKLTTFLLRVISRAAREYSNFISRSK